jgi:nitroimidazol reductase NimA-like FMN-containing flavoprotein (pyridoxamine 5'-phosphate oxidase superfamily)
MSQASDEKYTSRFAEIPRPRCLELLAQKKGGRVAWNAADGPKILPVNYKYWNGQVVFRTAPNGPLASLAHRTRVAFEIDEIDDEKETGWSVLVTGAASAVTHSYNLSTLWRNGPVPWAGGVRNVLIAISPESVTGRAVKSFEVD